MHDAPDRVLSDHRVSVMAMLAAFVHDPLINWRLLARNTVSGAAAATEGAHERGSLGCASCNARAADAASPRAGGEFVVGSVARRPLGAGGAAEGPMSLHVNRGEIERAMTQALGAPQRAAARAATKSRVCGARTLRAGPEGSAAPAEALNERAVAVIARVQAKLSGRDFPGETLTVPEQVERLVQQATSHENLSQCYIGWCPFW